MISYREGSNNINAMFATENTCLHLATILLTIMLWSARPMLGEVARPKTGPVQVQAESLRVLDLVS